MNKPNKNTVTENRVVVTRGKGIGGGGRAKREKGINCMVMDRN